MSLTALHREYQLAFPKLELLTQSGSLIIFLCAQGNTRVRLTFQHFCAYRSRNETYSLDATSPLAGLRGNYHWLYVTEDSEFLLQFRERNRHTGPNLDVKHFLILTLDDIIDVVATDCAVISAEPKNGKE